MDALGNVAKFINNAGHDDQRNLYSAILEYAHSMEAQERSDFLGAVSADTALYETVCAAMTQMAELFAVAFAREDQGDFEKRAEAFLAQCVQDTPLVKRLRDYYFANYESVDFATEAGSAEQERMILRIMAVRERHTRSFSCEAFQA